jgi:glucose-6-phosphate isomerase
MSHDVLVFDPSGADVSGTQVTSADLLALTPQLDDARAKTLKDLELLRSGQADASSTKPLDAGFIDLPDRLLADYRKDPNNSEVGRILASAKQMSELVDRAVVVGIGGSYMGSRSLFEALCHPYHNLLSRSERGGRPKLLFAGYNVDNDLTQGLLDLLGRNKQIDSVDDRWGLMVFSKSGSTLESAVAFRQLFNELCAANDKSLVSKIVVAVTGEGSKLDQLAKAAELDHTFPVPENVGGRFSILSACGLLPAAVLGLDIVKLLEGASAMNAIFRSEKVGANPVLDYTGVCHLMERDHNVNIRVLSMWDQGLEAIGFWYDQLLSESLGKEEKGATPITVVNTRDLHSRGQQHQEGRRDKLITNVTLATPRRDPLTVGTSEFDQDDLNRMSGKTVPEIMRAAIDGNKLAYKDVNRPTTDLILPSVNEYNLGQLYQMLMLATAVEGYLIGINPYGQPGVEAYKKHMNALLSN